jgi:SAM-dependent methyltransferase
MIQDDIAHPTAPAPSAWIRRFAGEVPRGGPVVDIACGGGRHGRLFLERGHPVVFADRDVSGVTDLAGHPGVEIIAADFEGGDAWPLAGRHFAGVVVTNYLWRPILPRIIDLVGAGGLLLYETFALGNEAYGRPRNPDFLLRPGELFEAVRGKLSVLAYEQCVVTDPRPAVIQHIAARRPDNTRA